MWVTPAQPGGAVVPPEAPATPPAPAPGSGTAGPAPDAPAWWAPAAPVTAPAAEPLWRVPAPGGGGTPPHPRGRRLGPVVAGVAVAAVALGAAAVWLVPGDGAPRPEGRENVSAAPTTPGTESGPAPGPTSEPSEPTSAPTSAPVTPSPGGDGSDGSDGSDGRRHDTVTDPAGFTLAVPHGWTREDSANGVFYRSPDRTALIQVFRVTEPDLTPLEAVRAASGGLRKGTPNYREISVGPAPGDPSAAELVYEYDSEESKGRRRGVERVFVADDGGKWALLAAGPAGEWTVTRQDLTAALEAFRVSA
ncbi:serine/arginine repetitive matrix protein 2 [Streptomyces sp. NPDC012888]|uniref:serine/arginine repetitive matrix protein 2 n=1 Tax=Streptomyces sp. NPDC012888 TaxID=3364855 RepID=UPI0036C7D1C6